MKNEPNTARKQIEEVGSHFAVPTDEKFALARVDFVPGERIKFDLLYSEITGQDMWRIQM